MDQFQRRTFASNVFLFISARPIYTLDIHPDGKRLATGGLTDGGGLITLWDMAFIRDPSKESPSTLKKLYQMDNHQACVNCVRWSPTGRWLASGGMDRVIMLWVKTVSGAISSSVFGASEKMKFSEHWRCLTVLRHHTGDIIDLSWAQDGVRLASASVDNTVVIWSPSTNTNTNTIHQPFQCIAVLRGHRGPVKGVTWDPVGRYLATQADDLGVRIWRTADWLPESKITAPFANAADQSEVTRLSWSPDGSAIAAPHAVNNNFPTAQLITRNRWQTGLDLVGHEKHVTCAKYNPNLLKNAKSSEASGMVCLALGSKDRSVSVWTTLSNRALVVIRDLFTSSVTDLTWSANGRELLASSLDGSISYMAFTRQELGDTIHLDEVARLHRKLFGQSLLDGLLRSLQPSSSASSLALRGGSEKPNEAIVLETPEALALQRSQAELRQKLNASASINTSSLLAATKPPKPSVQTEAMTKDGRRRITPSFLGSLDCLDEEPPSSMTLINDGGPKPSEVPSPPPQQVPTSSPLLPSKLVAPTDNNSSPQVDSSGTPVKSSNASTNATTVAIPAPSSEIVPEEAATSKKRKYIELTMPTDEPKLIQKKKLTHKSRDKFQKKRKRSRLFVQDEDGGDVGDSSKAEGADAVDLTVCETNNSNLSVSRSPAKTSTLDNREKNDSRHASSLRAPKSTVLPPARSPDQLEQNGDRAQFVCCHSTEGPIIINIINSKAERGALHKITGARCYDGNNKPVWTLSSSERFTCHTHADNWLAVGDNRGRLRLLWSVGPPICPPIHLDSTPLHLATASLDSSSSVRLAAITASGRLIVWSLSPTVLDTARPSFGRSLNLNLPKTSIDTTFETPLPSLLNPVTSLEMSSDGNGNAVVRFKSGSCLLFHCEKRLWIELFDADGDDFKRRAAVTIHRVCPSGPLAALQQFGRLAVGPGCDSIAATPVQRLALREFLDAQVQVAELFGSAAEFKFWLLRWFRQLIEDDEDERVRHVCLDFIGPFTSAGGTSWEPSVKGLSKRALVEDLLPLFALNLGMQRLYVEIKELLEQASADF